MQDVFVLTETVLLTVWTEDALKRRRKLTANRAENALLKFPMDDNKHDDNGTCDDGERDDGDDSDDDDHGYDDDIMMSIIMMTMTMMMTKIMLSTIIAMITIAAIMIILPMWQVITVKVITRQQHNLIIRTDS